MNQQVTLFRDNQTGLDFAAELGEVTSVSWQPPTELTFEEWTAIGNTLQQVGASLNWWIGDWLNYGEHKWGEMYAQAVEVTGWDYDRLRNAKWVARSVEMSFRNDKLTWTHHSHVASMEPDEQSEWLELASANGWRSGQLKDAIKASKQLPVITQPAQPNTNGNGNGNGNGYHEPAEYADEVPFTAYRAEPNEQEYLDEEQESVKVPHVSHNSGNNEWYTPSEYIEAARRVMGGIDLDPASSDTANEIVNAERYYTAEQDGLLQEWHGCVWMNPPYAGELIGKFANKLAYHVTAGDIPEAVVLVNNATETIWFTTLIQCASAVVFPTARIRYLQPDGLPKATGLQGQAVLYFGRSVDTFLSEFKPFGWGATIA